MKLLMHMCCSNCSLYPVKLTREEGMDYTGFWYNPNIHDLEEYSLRLDSVKKLAGLWDIDIHYIEDFSPLEYFNALGIADPAGAADSLLRGTGQLTVEDFPLAPAFPERCASCYRLRLEKTASHAHKQGYSAFTTTLLISPYQDYEGIVKAGNELAEKYNVEFFERDYRPFFREAMNMSRELGLYRQKYCGCIFSRMEREEQKRSKGK